MTMAGAKKGNLNATTHRVYLKKILNSQEQKIFMQMYDDIVEQYVLESRPVDQMLLSMALIDYIRALRGYLFESENPDTDMSDALERATRSMRNNLSEIGITGKYKTTDTMATSFSAVLSLIAKGGA